MKTLLTCCLALMLHACATPFVSQTGLYSKISASTIATDLVSVAAETKELAPGVGTNCFEAVDSEPVLSRHFEKSLRQNGYAVSRTPLNGQTCLSFRTLTRPGLTKARSYATVCMTQSVRMICREYTLPDGQPVSAFSLVGMQIADPPSTAEQTAATPSQCAEGPLLERIEIAVDRLASAGQAFRDEARLREIAERHQRNNGCIILDTPNTDLLLSRAESIEQSLRQYGVAPDRIERQIRNDATDSAVHIELRREKR